MNTKKKIEPTKSGQWLAYRITQIFGEDYGNMTRFREKLAELGLEVLPSTVSTYKITGLPPTTLGSPQICATYAKALQCTVGEILLHHGYTDIEILQDNLINADPDTLELIRWIVKCRSEENAASIKQLLEISKALSIPA